MARPILLAVDDDVSVLEAVVQDLRRQYGATYRIMRAASGQAGLDTLNQLKTRQEPVALLLSDQRMPGMNGVEFLERASRGVGAYAKTGEPNRFGRRNANGGDAGFPFRSGNPPRENDPETQAEN